MKFQILQYEDILIRISYKILDIADAISDCKFCFACLTETDLKSDLKICLIFYDLAEKRSGHLIVNHSKSLAVKASDSCGDLKNT